MREINLIQNHIPEPALPDVIKFLQKYPVQIKIKKDRITKLGDFRHPINGKGYVISINKGLNKYAFLITLLHEFAHLLTWEKYKNRIKPHGNEWKNEFRDLMNLILNNQILPEEIAETVRKYILNPKAASCNDMNLAKILRKYDENNGAIFLNELPVNTEFKIYNGRVFKKGETLRKRIKCRELISNRNYLFNPIAEVFPVLKSFISSFFLLSLVYIKIWCTFYEVFSYEF